MGPVWNQIYAPLLVLMIVGIAQGIVNLIRPDLTWLRTVVRIVSDLIWLALMLFVLQASDWVVVAPNDRHGKGFLEHLENAF